MRTTGFLFVLAASLAPAALALAACAPTPRIDPDTGGAPARALGMNDVTVLVPLPVDPAVPVVARIDGDGGDGLVSPELAARLLGTDLGPKNGLPVAHDDFHVVAIRFDLCARAVVGRCRDGEDGRLRLVLQPLYTQAGAVFAHDIALHGFYPIPAAELVAVVAELRALAQLQPADAATALAVSPALAAPAGAAAYAARLRTLVMRYARSDNLIRLTVFGQNASSAAFAWKFRGLDRRGGGFAPLEVPGLAGAPTQAVLLAGGDAIYATEPVADVPAGFVTAINGAIFGAASDGERRAAVDALVELQDPTRHDAVDVQCLSCHVATFLTRRRAEAIGVDPTTIAGRYESSYDLAVDTVAGRDPRVLRGLGWAAGQPAISQRVANDTAQVLTEIEARFPPP
ncbi:MAG TPA: hypothetical protein VM734_30390 [Kofleriaceae bacterium]|nr:hypothetical protein [Kofleriaceae bacterium]